MEANGKIRVRAPIVVLPATRDVADEFAAVAELDLGADHAERADLRARADFRAVLDDGGLDE